ncbi:MAG TPA: peptidyl-tRNA hydrolase [Spirochaetaceae bacterium]|nr:peptidyl-tRNA hydrolase [Spirochaetaceae bacterium]
MGLGNPGLEYSLSAHNVGFRCVDIAQSKFCLQERKKDNFLESDYVSEAGKVKFVKPLTFMNLSGEVFSYLRKEPIDKLIIFCDNIDLEPGKIRFHYQGSSAGHNGLKSIMSLNPKGNDFYRMYIGVGRETVNGIVLNAADSVLRKMSPEKISVLQESCEKAVDIVMDFIKDGDFEAAKRKCSERKNQNLHEQD